MSKDYRCKDCQWWKEYGEVCISANKWKHALTEHCRRFKLRKPIEK